MKHNLLDNITGIVFDYNGTLVFDAPMHVSAWSEISMRIRNKEVTAEENHQMSGKNNAVILQMMDPTLTPEQNKKLSLEKEAVYREMVIQQDLPLVPGVPAFFDLLKEKGIPFTIASASIKENILLGRSVDENEYRDVIQRVNLGYLLERYENQELNEEIVSKLSGGEKQKLSTLQ